ncbi:involucrin-like [Gossypium australe]|uniref:Involucrin-like n=1 Tax=Gossypium australe TaxID=47621 RepID=A0A5B6VDT4_9ROSI|nr:involucrin-like [Gossypium australe]
MIELKANQAKIEELKRKIEELEAAMQNCELRIKLLEMNIRGVNKGKSTAVNLRDENRDSTYPLGFTPVHIQAQ